MFHYGKWQEAPPCLAHSNADIRSAGSKDEIEMTEQYLLSRNLSYPTLEYLETQQQRVLPLAASPMETPTSLSQGTARTSRDFTSPSGPHNPARSQVLKTFNPAHDAYKTAIRNRLELSTFGPLQKQMSRSS